MNPSRSGFLVVLQTQPKASARNPLYSGVDRIPAYPSGVAEESDALDDYVFGPYKNQSTNLIDDYFQAYSLLERFQSSPRRFEIIAWRGRSAVESFASRIPSTVRLIALGTDVAVVDADYWSIVDDIPPSSWADAYVAELNEYGLFPDEEIAKRYLSQYQERAEADADFDFDIGTILRPMPIRR